MDFDVSISFVRVLIMLWKNTLSKEKIINLRKMAYGIQKMHMHARLHSKEKIKPEKGDVRYSKEKIMEN